MPIIILDGANADSIGVSMREEHIAEGGGVLLVTTKQDGEPRHQLEKIIAGMALPAEPVAAKDIPWKPNPLVIVADKKEAILEEFEALVPGFTKLLGPVKWMKAG